jgi:5-(carboxyamino)imidazole ribonucleotide mutase
MSDVADPNPPEIGTAELPDPELDAELTDPEVEAELEQIEENYAASGPLVGIVVGSSDDLARMLPAEEYLSERGIDSEVQVLDSPVTVGEYCEGARAKGLKVIIVGASMSTALPGIAAGHTDLPVIGVPLSGRLTAAGGLDAILSIVQMPPGVPVACVGLNNPRNAAILAAQIIAS